MEQLKNHRIFFGITTLMLFTSFSFNVFGAMTTDAFVLNYKDSEMLVYNQIKCGGRVYSDQLLESKAITPIDGTDYSCKTGTTPYSSQFGLQGRVYTGVFRVVSKITHISTGTYVAIAQLTTALMSAIVFGLFVLWVRVNYSGISASIVTLLLAMSPMIVGFARNLYWALPLFIAPFVFALYKYRLHESRKSALVFWSILGSLLYLRYLCGYEYITTFTIMTVAVVVYFLYMGKAKRVDYYRQIAISCMVSVLAFGAALATHVVALNSYTGSTGKSIDIVMKRAQERTVNGDKYLQYPYMNLKNLASDYYRTANTYVNFDDRVASGSKLWSISAAITNYLLLPVVSLPLNTTGPLTLYIQSTVAFITALAVLYIKRDTWVNKKINRSVKGLYLAMSVGLVGYLSWLVLANAHSLVHAHINGILMYLPFALFGYVVIGVFVEYFIMIATKTYKR